MKTKQPPLKRTRELEFRSKDTPGAVGVANMIGGIDSYWTITHPNSPAFSESERTWTVENGAFLSQHKWGANPIGFINSVNVDGRNLLMDVAYHSTDDAEDSRTIAKERMDAGKSVGWSIGFDVTRYEWFENGAKCIQALESRNEDLTLYDVEAIRAHGDDCWLMWIERIYEVSQVNFASSTGSGATAVRSLEFVPSDESAQIREALIELLGDSEELKGKSTLAIIREVLPIRLRQLQKVESDWMKEHSKPI